MVLQGRNLSLSDAAPMRGEDVALLHTELAQLREAGLLDAVIDDDEVAEQLFGATTQEAVMLFQEQHGLESDGIVEEETARHINEEVDALKPYVVEGRVFSRSRAGIGGLRIEIVDKNVGDDVRLAETTTDEGGSYRASFTVAALRQRGKQQPDLQARVFTGGMFLGASEVRYNALNRETLDVLLTGKADSALASEYETLTANLSTHFRGNLRDLQETNGRQDITYLANKTGWDARAVALAALADQFSARTTNADGSAGIEPALFYVLFRAGLPANEQALYQIDAKTAAAVWKQGLAQGVIPAALEDRIPQAVEQFQRRAVQRALDGPALAGVSPLKEMLSVSLGDDPERQQQFTELYVRHRVDSAQLWEAVRGAFGEEVEQRLRVDGQLGYLTLNNAPLIQKLHAARGEAGLVDTLELVEEGYYRAEKWQETLGDGPIPPEVSGADDAEKRSRYAELMAAQVRLSFPTAVVAQMVKRGETPLADGLQDQVHVFLMEHQGKFEIGLQPVEQYVVRNNVEVAPEVTREITRIQRAYQITPSDDAMNALLKKGVDSAYAVVRYDRDQFVRAFKDEVGGEASARLIHAKAQQVHNVVLNIALSYLTARVAPGIGVHSPAQYVDPAPHASDVIAYPTLERLFGEMDYCACEHCRSILSPAAYLVNLLQFIDPKPEAWAEDLNDWQNEHGVPYPYTNQKAWEDAGKPPSLTPLEVLLSRRPDIQHLPLTCENTNTPLPYIDLVNETLEFFVANNLKLKDENGEDYRGYSTNGEATPEELLASPQFGDTDASDKAYNILAEAHFPPPLPFHQPLENLRRYFDRFEAPLPQVMEALRKDESVERANESGYGWRDILMEALRLSRAEYALLSERALVNGSTDVMLTVKKLYGFDPATAEQDVRQALGHAKSFSRRVDITYEELTEVLKTRFVNPNSTLIPKLERLGVPFATLKKLKDTPPGDPFDAKFDALLPPGLDASQYGGDIKAWVKDEANYARIMGLITLTAPVVPWAASTTYKQGDYVTPTSPPTGSAFIYECTTPGTSASVEPSPWPTTPGDTYTDGTVVWTCRVGLSDCKFDNLRFRYADPDKLAQNIRDFEFVRLIRFIRLWKKLDWTIEQTDKAITALYPADQIPDDAEEAVNLQRLDAGFLTLLPRLGEVKRVMKALKLSPKKDLLPLLACFAPIDTHGATSLYRQMFLSPVLLRQNSVFADDGYGNFLQKVEVSYSHPQPTLEQPILDAASGHITYDPSRERLSYTGVLSTATRDALKAATGVTEAFQAAVDALYTTQRLASHAEVLRAAFLLTAEEFSAIVGALGFDANTPLTLNTISAVFRRGWLARKLKLSVREFLLLTQYADLDPFAAPDPPHPPIQRLLELIARLRAAPLKPLQALYLIWNQDISGLSAPEDAEINGFARTLRSSLETIEREFALADDPDGSIARVRMALVYGDEATDHFFGLLEKKVATDVPYVHPQATLSQAALDAAQGHIAYDPLRKRLSYTAGVMPDTMRDALKAVAGVTASFQNAVDDLYTKSRAFFARYPELQPLYDTYVASSDPVEKKRSDLLVSFLPELIRRRKRQHALQAVSAATQVDVEFANILLDDAAVLHAAADTTRPALEDLMAIEAAGLAAQFFFADTAGGTPDVTRDAEANLAYAAGGANELPVNGNNSASAISGLWSGYLEAPENGFYNFHIEADAGATLTLTLNGAAVSLAQDGNLWSNSEPIELGAGTLYPITLTVEKVKDLLTVRWESTGRGREVIPPRYLYSTALIEHLRTAYVRFLKAMSLAAGTGLTAGEIAYLVSEADYHINGQGWLNSLPVTDNPDNVTASALLTALNALLDFARINANLAPRDERLLTILEDPAAATQTADGLLYTLTRWEPGSLDALLARFGKTAVDLSHVETFRRVYDAYAWVKTIGISPSALIEAATNEPTASTVRGLQAALRARYDESGWLRVVRPLNDEMRGLQRDALVAYILHQMRSNPASEHIDTPEKLFEYFLMDVQMDPCMQTSRVRHALSSVQLFIERCLMNLEPRVAPSVINAKQWAWMKRYRVWEANRKVFLWPENWLEPELRDDQSPFFKETMSELLQSDITEDRAAVALLNYLSKLEEVAKLEPCGIHYVEGKPGTADDVAHVVARTAGGNRKYYYRRREGGSWTPWEQIKLDIEDSPVIPVVWKGRLFLFWLKILKQISPHMPQLPSGTNKPTQLAEVDPSSFIKSEPPQVEVRAVLCWSEYYNGKWQPTRTSNINDPAFLTRLAPDDFDRSKLLMSVVKEEPYLRLLIYSDDPGASYFNLYNTHSLPEWGNEVNYVHGEPRHLMPEGSTFRIKYSDGNGAGGALERPVLKSNMSDRTIQPRHDLQHVREAPFFYEDSRHVFYVTTETRLVPIPAWGGFGAASTPDDSFLQIPPLVLEEAPHFKLKPEPDPFANITFDGIAQDSIQRLVTEDAYIDKAIGTIGTIAYGNVAIGMGGGLFDKQHNL